MSLCQEPSDAIISSMPLRRISSLLTFPYKFGFPALFGVVILNMLIWQKWTLSSSDGFILIVAFLMPIAFLSVTFWMFGPVKKVLLDEKNQRLYVSNFRKEISIPFSEIASVSEFIFSDPARITIRLRSPSEFGQKIVFLGTYRFGGWLAGSHPIVEELPALAAEAAKARLNVKF